MGSVIYTPMLEVARDEEIIKQIINEESLSNMSGDDIKAICSKISGSKKESCYAQLEGTEKTSNSEKDLIAYYKAVSRGYTKSIDEFLKKKSTLSKLMGAGTTALGLLSGLASSSSNQGTDYKEVEEDKKGLSTGAKWGIGIGSAVVLGTVLFFIFKK